MIFLLIATVVVSLETLARDFAGWGKRYPNMKREAERLLGGFPLRERVWLMDMYLYPSLGIHREFASALAPSLAAEHLAVSDDHGYRELSVPLVRERGLLRLA